MKKKFQTSLGSVLGASLLISGTAYAHELQTCSDGHFLVSLSNATESVQNILASVISVRTGERVKRKLVLPPGGTKYACLAPFYGQQSYNEMDFDVTALPNFKCPIGRILFSFEPHAHPLWPIAKILVVAPDTVPRPYY